MTRDELVRALKATIAPEVCVHRVERMVGLTPDTAAAAVRTTLAADAERLAEALDAALSTFRDRLDGLPDDASGDLALPDARAAFAAALTRTPSGGEDRT